MMKTFRKIINQTIPNNTILAKELHQCANTYASNQSILLTERGMFSNKTNGRTSELIDFIDMFPSKI